MRRILVVAVLLVLAASVSAHAGHAEHEDGSTVENVSSVLESPGEFAASYNANADGLPSLVKSLVSGERINVHVDTGGDEVVIGLMMAGAKVGEVQEGGVEDPTVEFYTDEETLQSVLDADNTGRAAVSAFNGDGIRYEAHGLGSQVKFAVLSVLSKVLGVIL